MAVDVEPLAADTIEWKRAQLKEQSIISPTFADPRLLAFFADAAGDSARPTGCRVMALECDGAAAAAGIFIACKDHMASHVALRAFHNAQQAVCWGELVALEYCDFENA